MVRATDKENEVVCHLGDGRWASIRDRSRRASLAEKVKQMLVNLVETNMFNMMILNEHDRPAE